VLAVLLIEANQVVSVDQLVDRVWEGRRLPADPVSALRTYVSLLRRVIAAARNATISRQSAGYKAIIDTEAIDLHRFRRLVGQARSARDDDDRALLLEHALQSWRGVPLAGLDSPWIDSIRSTLTRQRQEVRLDLIDVQLRRGQHSALVPELSSQVAEHPLDERVAGQFMVALYRSGRQADAFAQYRQLRERLVDELGTEPGPRLQQLHQQILTADPALTETSAAPGTAPVTVPRQLPADVPGFTGRALPLAELDRLLATTAGQPGAASARPVRVVISAVSGTAGVGKTALAVHWAHQVSRHFPDGQLYVNLRGYDPDQPMATADALAGFLRALGVAGQDIPVGADERAARYRSLLAGRRVLVVLDNAGTAEQVRPLLPGSAACVTVVTSRDALAGLVARDGARRLDLDLLPPADAVGLLRALIGGRVDADPATATVLADQCARLPLALRVAAELAAARPAVPLADLAGELADQQRRLDLLDADGDPRTAVRAVFSWSRRHLSAEANRTFRLAGMHPGPDLEPYSVAALTGTALEDSRRLLDQLARAHLIQPAGPGRYGLHDLLRTYARELTTTEDGEDELRAARTRMFDYYLRATAVAMDILAPAEQHRRPLVPSPATSLPPMPDPAAARAWLAAELTSLVNVCAHTATHGWPGHATQLAAILFRYLEGGGYYPEAISIHTHARQAARHIGDQAAEARALTGLGLADFRQGRGEQATGHFRQALALFRAAGDRTGEARVQGNLGIFDLEQGRCQQASEHFRQALALFRLAGDRTGEAHVLSNLGNLEQMQGHYREATSHYWQALALSREIGDRTCEAYTLDGLGCIDRRRGRHRRAANRHQQALDLFREIGNRSGEAHALVDLGLVDLWQGRYRQAADHHQRALDLFREIGDRSGEAVALNGLGEVLLVTAEPAHAQVQHAKALDLASQTSGIYEQARAHNGLARLHDAAGDHARAHRHWQEALTRYTLLGAPEAEQVRARLTMAGGHEHHEPLGSHQFRIVNDAIGRYPRTVGRGPHLFCPCRSKDGGRAPMRTQDNDGQDCWQSGPRG
jgi:DNA-binding SARP family transcriptional activator/tetratricopeptide (TPR) repeat protein